MKKVIILFLCLAMFGFIGCTKKKDTVADIKSEKIFETYALTLDKSTVEDIINYMNRSADSMERGSGDKRNYIFEMRDGSELIFVMEPPKIGSGLVLSYIDTE